MEVFGTDDEAHECIVYHKAWVIKFVENIHQLSMMQSTSPIICGNQFKFFKQKLIKQVVQ